MDPVTTEPKNSAGQLLKQGRLKQRLSIAECAKRTHIAPRYVEALEEEQWDVLPSESHRLGFLKLYSRFLGVPVEEVLTLYQQSQKQGAVVEKSASSPVVQTAPRIAKSSQPRRWTPNSISQVIGIAILTLALAWVVYHAVSPRILEQNPMPWTRRHSSQQSRLIVPKTSVTTQRVRIKAEADSWLRVTTKNELLFEGILPAGMTKEWSGTNPFQFKIGNIRAVSLYWNDQPVDLTVGSRGTINEIRIPPQ